MRKPQIGEWRMMDSGIAPRCSRWLPEHLDCPAQICLAWCSWLAVYSSRWGGSQGAGEGAKEQVTVVGPRYNNMGDSGHTDLKHVSQHLLLQACSNPAAEEKKLNQLQSTRWTGRNGFKCLFLFLSFRPINQHGGRWLNNLPEVTKNISWRESGVKKDVRVWDTESVKMHFQLWQLSSAPWLFLPIAVCLQQQHPVHLYEMKLKHLTQILDVTCILEAVWTDL